MFGCIPCMQNLAGVDWAVCRNPSYGCTDVCGCTDSGLHVPPTVRPGRSNSSGPAGASAEWAVPVAVSGIMTGMCAGRDVPVSRVCVEDVTAYTVRVGAERAWLNSGW